MIVEYNPVLIAKYFATFWGTLLSLQVVPLLYCSADEGSKLLRNIGNSLPKLRGFISCTIK
jgi:hypothetical protein